MRILVVSQYFWPENFRINELAASLVERGHSVTVLTGIPNYPEGKFAQGYGCFKRLREDYKGVKIVRVPLIPRGNGNGFRLLLNYVSYFISASIIGPIRCNESYDIIFVCQLSPVTVALPAIVLKKLKNLPVVMWILDLWPESLSATGAVSSPRMLGLVGALVRYIYRHCDRILVSSRGFVSALAEQRVSPSMIEYFPNWVEEEYLPVPVSEAESRLDLPNGFRIVFAGNIGAAQDFETILDAAELVRDIPEIQWIIVGDGRKVKWVAEQVLSRGLEKTFHLVGRHPAETMPLFFAAANVMLVTLKNNPIFSLTVPGKIQSYLACGRPIVASIAGEGCAVVEEAMAGLVCTPGDPKSLAGIVLRMYRMDAPERENMGRNGKLYAENHFNRSVLVDKLNMLLETVHRRQKRTGKDDFQCD